MYQPFDMSGGPSFRVVNFIMMETASYDSQYIRPFQTTFNSQTGHYLQEFTEGGRDLSTSALGNVASSILQPASSVSGVAPLPQGFGEKRFSFMLELVTNEQQFTRQRIVVTGYTDYLGVSTLSGQRHIDPNMPMRFNNIFMLRDAVEPGATGNQNRSNLVSANHVVQGPAVYDPNNAMTPGEHLYTMRPEDVFARISTANNDMIQGQDVMDTRAMATAPVAVSRKMESRPEYLSNTMKSYQTAQTQSETWDDDPDYNTVYDQARNYTRTSDFMTNPFVSALSTNTGWRQTGQVTYGEMCSLIDGFDEQAQVVLLGRVEKQQAYHPGQGEHWHGSNQQTLTATVFQQVLPAIMVDSLITRIGIRATNDTVGAQHDVRPYDIDGFTENVDLSPYLQALQTRVIQEILQDISKQGMLVYHIDVHVDLRFESRFWISIEHEPAELFVSPAFCDAIYSPLTTNQPSAISTMANDVELMLHNINGQASRLAGQQSPMMGGGMGPGLDPNNTSL